MIIHWAPIPAFFIRFDGLRKLNPRQPSRDIAAMKLYILFAIKIKTHGVSGGVSLTYDEMTEMVGLSRTLVSAGIKRLLALDLIDIEGAKKKRYMLKQDVNYKGWTKTPARPLFNEKGTITAFASFHNRYDYELNSLKLFLYLLFIRSNDKPYSVVTNAKIYQKTGMTYSEIHAAIGFMEACGLLISRKLETEGGNPLYDGNDNMQAYRYEILGGGTLVKGSLISSVDNDDDLDF
ncbi:hypothetical protein BFS14_00060 [Serratia fonticola]|uniref:hypothetical protein n=1 Tax=Serratia fonticola TaxID=47917 RepID=UPI0008FD55BA|nr:hypothetical protein [Serratia fonticola]OIX95894.1 hypothetical protein BFS14_00060 [Serratia fonticola]QCR61177.1 hypothetical protein FD644_12715 [Serratia fonticola]HEJ9058697.1 hypothetical protein [Serratia fonticola]